MLDTDELSVDAVLARAAAPGAASGALLAVTAAAHRRPARRVVAVDARSRPLDRHLVVPAVLPGAGAPPATAIPATGPVVVVANHSVVRRTGRCCSDYCGGRAVFLVKREMFVGLRSAGRCRASARSRCAAAGRPAAADGRPWPCCGRGSGRGVPGGHPRRRRRSRPAQHGAAWLARTSGAVGAAGGVPGHPPCRDGAGSAASARGSTCWWGSRSPLPRQAAAAPAWPPPTETVRAALAGLVRSIDEVRSETT